MFEGNTAAQSLSPQWGSGLEFPEEKGHVFDGISVDKNQLPLFHPAQYHFSIINLNGIFAIGNIRFSLNEF